MALGDVSRMVSGLATIFSQAQDGIVLVSCAGLDDLCGSPPNEDILWFTAKIIFTCFRSP